MNISTTVLARSLAPFSFSSIRHTNGPTNSAYLCSLIFRFFESSSCAFPRRKLRRRERPPLGSFVTGVSSDAARDNVAVRKTKAMLWFGAVERMSRTPVLVSDQAVGGMDATLGKDVESLAQR